MIRDSQSLQVQRNGFYEVEARGGPCDECGCGGEPGAQPGSAEVAGAGWHSLWLAGLVAQGTFSSLLNELVSLLLVSEMLFLCSWYLATVVLGSHIVLLQNVS